MSANISTPPTPSVTAWLRCSISRGLAVLHALRRAWPSTAVARCPAATAAVDLGEIDHLAQGARFGHPHPAHVEVEVEVGVDDPARRRRRQGRHDDLLPQPQHLSGGVLEAGPEAVPSPACVSRSSSAMMPDRVRGLASPRCKIWSSGLSSSGSPAASSSGTLLMATTLVGDSDRGDSFVAVTPPVISARRDTLLDVASVAQLDRARAF